MSTVEPAPRRDAADAGAPLSVKGPSAVPMLMPPPWNVRREEGWSATVTELLSRYPTDGAYPLQDLSDRLQFTTSWVASRDGVAQSILVQHQTKEPPGCFVHLIGEPDGSRHLLSHLPSERFVLVADPELSSAVEASRPGCRAVPLDVYRLDRTTARLGESSGAVRLGPEHVEPYARLVVPTRFPIDDAMIARNREHLRRGPVYGWFESDRLVSAAGVNARTNGLWMIGGVETVPEYRRRGLARRVVSATLRESLDQVERIGLWVVPDNEPAIALYRSLGFQLDHSRIWLDCGTGQDP